MKIAYLDCASGISGDMVLGALVDAGADLAVIQRGIDSLWLPGCVLVSQETRRKGFRAIHVNVEHEPEHAHRHLHQIVAMIDASTITEGQKSLAKRIFGKLAEAEAKVHGTTIEKVHFHEVGAVDSIADIVGAAIGWDLLGVEKVYASPIPTGTGFIEIAHGRCSIPAPATAELLQGIPLASSSVPFELTTPTGAAILATLVDGYQALPAMTVDRVGYGAGSRELEQQPNLLRLLVGEAVESTVAADSLQRVWQVETNLDDCPGEWVGYCVERLWQAGALDVATASIQMKKNRPGIRVTVLCTEESIRELEAILFRETTTLGVRRWPVQRSTLERETVELQTPWGPMTGTLSRAANGQISFAPDFEAARELATNCEVPLRDVYDAASRAAEELRRKP